MADAVDYLGEVRDRLGNPAVSDAELVVYINAAFRDVSAVHYTGGDYRSQIVETALQYLAGDNKFPEIGSTSAGGVSTSFAAGEAQRYRERLAARRSASWMNGTGKQAY